MKENRVAEIISKIISSAMNTVGDRPLRAVIEGEKVKYEIVWKEGEVKISLSEQRQ